MGQKSSQFNTFIINELCRAAYNGDKDTVEEILLINPQVINSEGSSYDELGLTKAHPLLWASFRNQSEVVKLLLIKGAEVNLQSEGLRKLTALMAAAWEFPDIVDILLKAGADIYLRSAVGRTAIEYAKENCRQDIITMIEEVCISILKTFSRFRFTKICNPL